MTYLAKQKQIKGGQRRVISLDPNDLRTLETYAERHSNHNERWSLSYTLHRLAKDVVPRNY